VPSSQGDYDASRIGQGDLPDNGRPARERRPLQAKEEEHTTKEAFDGGTLAQFFGCPSGRQTGAILLILGVLGNHRNGSQAGMDPVNELQAPIARLQPNDART
jgi:hypothetical protein